MAIDLVTKFAPYTDEQFKNESKKSLLTNDDFDWTGAHTIKVYKISTSTMNDYKRNGPVPDGQWSRFGPIADLDATTEEMSLNKDRSFTFAIDKLDTDETAQQLAGASALSRQNREIIIPEVDAYTYGVMAANAGHKPAALALTAANIFEEITKASLALDDAEVPETGACAAGDASRLHPHEAVPRHYPGQRRGAGNAPAGRYLHDGRCLRGEGSSRPAAR